MTETVISLIFHVKPYSTEIQKNICELPTLVIIN